MPHRPPAWKPCAGSGPRWGPRRSAAETGQTLSRVGNAERLGALVPFARPGHVGRGADKAQAALLARVEGGGDPHRGIARAEFDGPLEELAGTSDVSLLEGLRAAHQQ